jgi:YD repeat-containing protein
MATRKKKTDTVILDMPGTIGSAKLVFPNESKVVKGSHLTVTTHPDGKTTLEWDDEALLRDVRAALLKAESVLPVTESKSKRKTKEM